MEQKIHLTYRGAVRPTEVNGLKEMNIQTYIDRYEQSGRQFFKLLGLTKAVLSELNAGVAVIEHDIQFESPAFEDDLIRIESYLVEFTDKVFTVHHSILDDTTGELRSKAIVKLLLFNMTIRKAIEIPASIKQRLKELL